MSAAALSALLLACAGKRFREPEFFEPMVPEFLCRDDSGERANGPHAVLSREEWVAASGLLEVGCALGLLIPATRRAAACCVTAIFTLLAAGRVEALRKAYRPAQGQPAARTPTPGRWR